MDSLVLMAADGDVNDAANGAETSFTSSNIVTLLGNMLLMHFLLLFMVKKI